MLLKELLAQARIETLPVKDSSLDSNPEVLALEHDSRKVREGALFFAIEGEVTDGHLYLDQVSDQGGAGVVSQRSPRAGFSLPWVRVRDVRRAMAMLADAFYGSVSTRMPLIGVTGTNGKTTTAHLIHSILNQDSDALMMGTVQTVFGSETAESKFTTPEAIEVQQTLRRSWEKGCRRGVLEASSHALDMNRLYQVRFPVAVFTNLTRDHLDYHGSFQNYFRAKRRLFESDYNPGLRWAVVNGDDECHSRLPAGGETSRIRFGWEAPNDVFPIRSETSLSGSRMKLQFREQTLHLESSLAGRHNIYNIMAAAAATSALGVDIDTIQKGIQALKCVPGRFERVEIDHPSTVFLDYAHTPDALENVLRLCRSLTRGRIVCVFGCGGDRDKTKRPIMGRISTELSDYTIITSDNPRSEDPLTIVEEIVAGIPARCDGFEACVERKEAIARALEVAREGDLVLLAGKGHETYQEVAHGRIHFDEREEIRRALDTRLKRGSR